MRNTKTGKILVILYLILAVGVFIYSSTCNTLYCNVMIFLPTLPWGYAFAESFNDTIFIVLVIINAIIIYGLGGSVGGLFDGKRTDRQSKNEDW